MTFLRIAAAFALFLSTTPLIAAGNLEGIAPIALAPTKDGTAVYVAETGAKQIGVFDLASEKATKSIALPEPPSGLAFSPDGSALYVTAGSEQGWVFKISTARGEVEAKIAVGHSPTAPVVSPDGKLLYVCNRFNNNVSVIDLVAWKELATVPVQREPVAAAITPNGRTLFVANLLPVGPATGDYVAAAVSAINTRSRQTTAIKLANGSSSVRGICVSLDGRFAYAVHSIARYQLPAMQLNRGWMNSSALSIIDAASKQLVATISLDDEELGAANPWSVACTADGRFLCITHAGTHEISVINLAELHTKLSSAKAATKTGYSGMANGDTPVDFNFLRGIRRRIKLAGNGPSGLAMAGTKAVAAEFFSDSLGIADITSEKETAPHSAALGAELAMSPVRRGEMLFNNAEHSFQQWQSCASCHPDGRADGFNWDLLNDGIGNPKNTKSMLWAHQTPPSMSLGIRKNAEAAVRSGIKYIEFADRPEEEARAIDEYLKSLQPVPSPRLVSGQLSGSAERGKAVFEREGCAVCHPSPLFTNLKQYDIGTGTGMDVGKKFDVPTLVELWRTAPYLHDGSAATVADVITRRRHAQHLPTLPEKEKEDLIQYLLSL